MNPGHTIECIWFIMGMAILLYYSIYVPSLFLLFLFNILSDTAAKRGNRELVDKMCESLIKTLEFGWDQKYLLKLNYLDFYVGFCYL